MLITARSGARSSTSTATTVPGTDAEAALNARAGLEASRADTPRTPVDKIRRTNTPILRGTVGDQPLLALPAPDPSSMPKPSGTDMSGDKQTKVRKTKLKKNWKTAKKKMNKMKNQPNQTLAPGENPDKAIMATSGHTAPLSVATAAAAPIVKLEKDSAKTRRPVSTAVPAAPACTLEKKASVATLQYVVSPGAKPPPTPPSVREAKAAHAALATSMQRADTAEQLGTTSTPAQQQQAVPQPSEENWPDGSDAEVSGDGDDKPRKKGKIDKTPKQKAAHARYMRFSRSVRSILAAMILLTQELL